MAGGMDAGGMDAGGIDAGGYCAALTPATDNVVIATTPTSGATTRPKTRTERREFERMLMSEVYPFALPDSSKLTTLHARIVEIGHSR